MSLAVLGPRPARCSHAHTVCRCQTMLSAMGLRGMHLLPYCPSRSGVHQSVALPTQPLADSAVHEAQQHTPSFLCVHHWVLTTACSFTVAQKRDWLALVAVHSDCWLLAVAFYNGARLNKEGR